MLIRGGGGGGELIRGGACGGEVIRGGAAGLVWPSPRCIPGRMPGCIIERGGVIDWFGEGTRCVTIPLVCTCCETLAMLDSPRGTPSPAELFWIMILLPERLAKVVTGPRFTARIVVPFTGAAGGCGRLNPPGVFNKTGVE